MSDPLIQVTDVADGVLQIQIDRPKALNALNTQVLTEIAQVLTDATDKLSIRVIVLTGDKRAFAAGADIGELQQAASGNFPEEQRQAAWKVLREFPKPIVAAVSGFALGGGCELMMTTDIVVASRTAQFGQPEINLGIMPGAGGTQRLTHLVGKPIAMKMNLSGEFISAPEALKIGLISEVTEPELYLERAIEIAAKIAKKSSVAAQAIKDCVVKANELSLADGLAYERARFLETVVGQDAAEGIQAFIEKRPAKFPNN